MSVTLGVSLAITGTRADRTDATDEPADGIGVDAQVEAVADVRARDVQLDRVEAGVAADAVSAIATNWSSSSPAMLAITAVPTVRR